MLTLKPEYAAIIQRIDLSGEQITLNNLTVRLHRARRTLRKALEDSCGICSKHWCLNCSCE